MCNYTEVNFGCTHRRYTVKWWCTGYKFSHKRCPSYTIAVEYRLNEQCGDCRKPSIHPSWVVRIRTTGFDDKLVVAPTRLLMHQTLAVTHEKRQNKAICVRPLHPSLLTTATLVDLVLLITLIRLLWGPRPWLACTMGNSVCTTITPGDSNLGDTTITHDTIGRIAGLVRKKRKRIFLEEEEETRVRKKLREADILVQ
ncbi:hypothetical protein IFR05_005872 [Cadophora sp. M221]|nr:hypothetical protein IFR05_005872 [Cadophora sp. M221]